MKENGIGSAKENSIKNYYERMLKEAEAETKRREEESQRQLVSDDPMGENYARWATEEEFCETLKEVPMEAQEAEESGIPMFCRDGVTYVDTSDSHTLIIGASGSKKTRLFIMPTILSLCKAGESMIVTDPKAELYERTSGKLKENGYRVYCVNFRDDSCQDCWNPLEAPRNFFKNGKFDLAVGLLNDFASISVPHDPNRGMDPFWDDSARATFMGMLLILMLLTEDSEQVNIRSLLRLRHTLLGGMKTENGKNMFQELIRLAGPDSLASAYLSGFAIAPEKTASSILATLDSHLLKFIIRPSLTDMLCHNDIDFHKIGEEKTAVFLVMPDEKETYHGLISIFVQQCYESLIFAAQMTEKKTLKRRVNFLLDEFSTLPPIREFPAMIAAARSRNIRFNIVVQSEKQLVSRYREEAGTIKGNCNNWIYLYSRELPTLEELSSLCGTQKSGKPLVTVSRLQRLSKEKGEVLLICGRKYPFLSRLEDISQYDHDTFEIPEYVKREHEPVKIFYIEEIFKEHLGEWIQARMSQDGGKELEVRRREQQLAEERAAEAQRLEEQRQREKAEALARQAMETASWLPLQPVVPQGGAVEAAADAWYQANQELFAGAGRRIQASWQCRAAEKPERKADPKKKTKEKQTAQKEHEEKAAGRILPVSPFPMNYLSVAAEMNGNSIALICQDEELADVAGKCLYQRIRNNGQMIPVYFDMKNFTEAWNPLVKERKGIPILLLLLASRLFRIELPDLSQTDAEENSDKNSEEKEKQECPEIAPQLVEAIDLLTAEFQRKPVGRPEYLVILNHMDLAANEADAVWQSWNIGSFPNVQLIVTLQEESREMLTRNCMSYINIRKGINANAVSRFVLFFDEDTNEVKAKQAPAPELWLELFRAENGCE